MRNAFPPKTLLIFACLLALFSNSGCKREPIGSSDNLKADYDRVVKERDDLKADFERRKAEIEGLWQQRVSDKDQKIAELTSEDASLRQRLLVSDAATQDVPLTDSARARSVMWLHVIYVLIIVVCLVLVMVTMRVHVTLRERMREYLLQQAKFIPAKEVSLVE